LSSTSSDIARRRAPELPGRGDERLSALDVEAAAAGTASLEFHHPAKATEAFDVSGARARFEHPDEVDGRCDLGAQTVAEVLPVRADAEVVVAACPPRPRHDPEPAGAGRSRHRLPLGELGCLDRFERGAGCTDLFERVREVTEVVLA
jgi:hypothetical protein